MYLIHFEFDTMQLLKCDILALILTGVHFEGDYPPDKLKKQTNQSKAEMIQLDEVVAACL